MEFRATEGVELLELFSLLFEILLVAFHLSSELALFLVIRSLLFFNILSHNLEVGVDDMVHL